MAMSIGTAMVVVMVMVMVMMTIIMVVLMVTGSSLCARPKQAN
jgi:hypothetical protein